MHCRSQINHMTTTKETCPKCGARVDTAFDGITYFDCLSTNERPQNSFEQSELCKARCRITELENEVERLRDATLICYDVLQSADSRIRSDETEYIIEGHQMHKAINAVRASALLEKKG
jgi:hypothetical protein